MTLEVVEIIARSEQGFTKPYICRCDDGEVYFVKGRSATRRGLINEWLCANLAEAFGLPIAPFALAEVPQELIEADLTGCLKSPWQKRLRILLKKLLETTKKKPKTHCCIISILTGVGLA